MSLRSQRFADTGFDLSPRPYTEPHPFAVRELPTKLERTLNQELENNLLYKKIWKRAIIEYERKKRCLSADHFDPSTPEQCYIAVIAYSLDDEIMVAGQKLQLYADFNRKFRQLTDEESWQNFPYKSFYHLLVLARAGIKNTPDPKRRLFRGIGGFRVKTAPKNGDDFYFDHFASASVYREKALQFTGDTGTLVEIRGGAEVGMGIAKYAYFDDEGEVIIFPCNKYKVVSFKKGKKIDNLVLERVEKSRFGSLLGGVIGSVVGGACGITGGPVGIGVGAAAGGTLGSAIGNLFSK